MNIDPIILQKLTNRRLFTARDILIATHLELVEALDIPFQAAEELLLYVCNQIAPASTTVLDLHARAKLQLNHVPTQLLMLDQQLRGGIPVGGITELAGSVMYIDTEKKFSSRRVVEMARSRWPHTFHNQKTIQSLTEHIIVVNPDSSEALVGYIKALEASIIDHNVKLVLVDSIAALTRSEFSRDKIVDRQQILASTGQPAQTQLTAALGTMWAHAVNTRLVLESVADVRYIKVAKSPAAPMAACAYRITEAGLELLEGHAVPAQVQSSVINMHVAHEINYEPQAMDI
ncbi:MAG: DNA repair RAD51 protein 2-like [Trebouxia sp. A1-2]|nr:MAG: DNA repair RAD51 protein 2-like [Trebouxia sp. A1-2]